MLRSQASRSTRKLLRFCSDAIRNLERLAVAKSAEDPNAPLSTGIKIERGLEPAAGFENAVAQDYAGRETTFLSSIAAARQEAQSLFELSQDLGASLSLGETLSVFSVKLKPMVPYDAIAIYIKREDELVPEYVNGDNYRLVLVSAYSLGQGLSGWVAHNRKPIINGNPSVEPGYSTILRNSAHCAQHWRCRWRALPESLVCLPCIVASVTLSPPITCEFFWLSAARWRLRSRMLSSILRPRIPRHGLSDRACRTPVRSFFNWIETWRAASATTHR